VSTRNVKCKTNRNTKTLNYIKSKSYSKSLLFSRQAHCLYFTGIKISVSASRNEARRAYIAADKVKVLGRMLFWTGRFPTHWWNETLGADATSLISSSYLQRRTTLWPIVRVCLWISGTL